jgi:hypothetical protein
MTAIVCAQRSIEKCQLLDRVARGMFGLHSTERWGLFRMQMAVIALSAFLNNTPIGEFSCVRTVQ